MVRREHIFDAPIDQVWAMFHNPASHAAKFTAMGHRDVTIVDQRVDDDEVEVTISRVVEIDLPGFAKKVMQPVNTVVSTDRWQRRDDGTYGGTFTADTKGAPVVVEGRTSIEAVDAQRTKYTIETDVRVQVPLIGKKLGEFTSGMVSKQLDDEFRCGDEWLAQR